MQVKFVEYENSSSRILEALRSWQDAIASKPLFLPVNVEDEEVKQILESWGVNPCTIELVGIEVSDLRKDEKLASTFTFTYEKLEDPDSTELVK